VIGKEDHMVDTYIYDFKTANGICEKDH